MTPYEGLMHEWIIEGLPPNVLVHHKRMLGIVDEEQVHLDKIAAFKARSH